jgi:hypothetical protein
MAISKLGEMLSNRLEADKTPIIQGNEVQEYSSSPSESDDSCLEVKERLSMSVDV